MTMNLTGGLIRQSGTDIVAVVGSGDKYDELARIDWSGMKVENWASTALSAKSSRH